MSSTVVVKQRSQGLTGLDTSPIREHPLKQREGWGGGPATPLLVSVTLREILLLGSLGTFHRPLPCHHALTSVPRSRGCHPCRHRVNILLSSTLASRLLKLTIRSWLLWLLQYRCSQCLTLVHVFWIH
jgi:hypothetical protein